MIVARALRVLDDFDTIDLVEQALHSVCARMNMLACARESSLACCQVCMLQCDYALACLSVPSCKLVGQEGFCSQAIANQ
jgi:hypothetical protein